MNKGRTNEPATVEAKPLTEEELRALAQVFPLPPDFIWEAAFSAAKHAGLSDDEACAAADATLADYVEIPQD